jgi:hypothetical protein
MLAMKKLKWWLLDTLELPEYNFWFKCLIHISTNESFYERNMYHIDERVLYLPKYLI